jgi:hypothetical protein
MERSGAVLHLVLTWGLVLFAVIWEKIGCAEEINHEKLLAQRVALSSLKNPESLILREDWMKGNLKPGENKLIPQQLFKNNQYQFWFAVSGIDDEVQLNIYNGDGKLMKAETVRFPPQKNILSIRVTPEATGMYYLRVAVTSSSKSAQDWALIYAYK